jgi:hypothetical protein
MSVYIKLTPLYLSITATIAVFCIFGALPMSQPLFLNSAARKGHYFLTHKWCFDDVNNAFVNRPLLRQAYNGPFKLIDKGLLEHLGPTGFGALVRQASSILVGAQTGRAYDYAGMFLASFYVALVFALSVLLS